MWVSVSSAEDVREFERVVRKLPSFWLRRRFWVAAWRRPGGPEMRLAAIAAYQLGGVAALEAMARDLPE